MEKELLKRISSISVVIFGGLLSIGSFWYLCFLSMFGFMVIFIKPYHFFGSILCFFVGIIFVKIGSKNSTKLTVSKMLPITSAFFRWLIAIPFLIYSLISAMRFGYGIFDNKVTNEYVHYAYMFIFFSLISSWLLWSEILWVIKLLSKKSNTPNQSIKRDA